MLAGVLTEIDISGAIPDLKTADYVAVSFERVKGSKAKLLVVGMRYDYVDQQQILLAGVSRNGNTLIFEGMNIQIVDGSGATDGLPGPGSEPIPSGLGNLIVGYDEVRSSASDKTGSHNLVVGPEHNYSSYGGLVAGFRNTVSGLNASVSGGFSNAANGTESSVSGGDSNIASGYRSSVSGGVFNEASAFTSSVSGGKSNTASGPQSSVSGGTGNEASGDNASVSGGNTHESSGDDDWRAGTLFEDN